MTKIRKVFDVFLTSAFYVNKYPSLLALRFRSSLVYYLALTTFLSIVVAGFAGYKTVLQIVSFVDVLSKDLVTLIPKDLEIIIKQGKIFINKPEPYFIKMPIDTASLFIPDDQNVSLPKHLITFDKAATLNDFNSLNTAVIVNGVNVLYYEAGNLKVVPLKSFPDDTFSYNNIESIMSVLNALRTKAFQFGVLFWLFTYFFGFVIFRLSYNFLAAGAIYIYFALNRKSDGVERPKMSYTKSYQLSLHALTLPVVLEASSVFLPTFYTQVFWFALLHMIIAFLAARNMLRTK